MTDGEISDFRMRAYKLAMKSFGKKCQDVPFTNIQQRARAIYEYAYKGYEEKDVA